MVSCFRLIALLLLCFCTQCQVPSNCKNTDVSCSVPAYVLFLRPLDPVSWLTFQGGTGIDTAASIIQTTDLGYIVVGQAAASFGSPVTPFAGAVDIAVVKLDRNGNRVWNTFAGGTGTDTGTAVAQTLDGNYVVTGNSDTSFGSPVASYSATATPDIITLKFDKNGNRLWHTYIGGASNDLGYAVAATSDGGAVINSSGASTFGSPIVGFGGATDFAIVKYDSNGNRVWNTFLGGGGSQDGYSISVVPGSGEILVSGVTAATFGAPINAYSAAQDLVVARLDSNGNLQWLTFAGGAGNDFPGKGSLTSDGGFILSGTSSATWGTPINPYVNSSDLTMVKFSSAGARQWNTFLGGTGIETIGSIAQKTDGTYCGTGGGATSFGSPLRAYTGGDDMVIYTLESNGTMRWLTFYGGSGNDTGNEIVSADDSGCIVAGYAAGTYGTPISAHAGANDFAIVKLFSNGTQ